MTKVASSSSLSCLMAAATQPHSQRTALHPHSLLAAFEQVKSVEIGLQASAFQDTRPASSPAAPRGLSANGPVGSPSYDKTLGRPPNNTSSAAAFRQPHSESTVELDRQSSQVEPILLSKSVQASQPNQALHKTLESDESLSGDSRNLNILHAAVTNACSVSSSSSSFSSSSSTTSSSFSCSSSPEDPPNSVGMNCNTGVQVIPAGSNECLPEVDRQIDPFCCPDLSPSSHGKR
ncbi:unnamed protein product [Protopolystoma xenopodis]|uniref:Uncharacterized protein n=1 Tax=Protopolystoma xenopodis TaxID=117903 RepID=A0A3S5AW01_9PLAT|nr:unnamed protein product [Protopolystoma xenopodis]